MTDPAGPNSDVTVGGSLILSEVVELPDTLDILVVGGGPAGTAVAFRAKELGLQCLVIDYDDLLKRIRDYSKEKEILANFGGGDKLPFPLAGDLVAKLQFQAMDKDEMVAAWKRYYRGAGIPARIGIELIGLGARTDGVWSVNCFNRRLQAPITYRARHVVIAIGRGVPRRFDIPGNTFGVATRLDDAAKYTGAPACVIGGGTSAAEAVIAISNAKVRAEDPTPVYWSYRGDSMPKVSDSLSKQFFDAFIGNGNIVYLRRSEPAAVVTGYDRLEYLSIRVDRKEMPGRPTETVHLEFPKGRIVACIGEDVPEGLLQDMGIEMRIGVDEKKRMLVSANLQTQREGVYVVGDLLAPFYWQTDSFDAPKESWQKVKHQGNIKTALHDGVRTAEVIHALVNGRSPTAASVQPAIPPPSAPRAVTPQPPSEAERKPAATPPQPDPSPPKTRRIVVTRLDAGGEPERYSFDSLQIALGRRDCDILLEQEALANERHASISYNESARIYELRDERSENGTYIYLHGKDSGTFPVAFGSLIIAGRQRLLLRQAGDGASALTHYSPSGEQLDEFRLNEGCTTVGLSAMVTLRTEDKTLSRSHCSLFRRGGSFEVADHSRNGTLVRVLSAVPLREGMRFVIGHTHFSFGLEDTGAVALAVQARQPRIPENKVERPGEAAAHEPSLPRGMPLDATPKQNPKEPLPPKPVERAMAGAPSAASSQGYRPAPASPVLPKAAGPQGSPSIEFVGFGTYPVKSGQTVLDVALANNIPIEYDCKDGTCGTDPVEILAGTQHVNTVEDKEEGGLENAGAIPNPCRLACCVRNIRGPIKVRVVTRS